MIALELSLPRGAARQRARVAAALATVALALLPPVRVTLTRLGPVELDEAALVASLVPLGLGVVDWLEVDPRVTPITWQAEQAPAERLGARIAVELLPDPIDAKPPRKEPRPEDLW